MMDDDFDAPEDFDAPPPVNEKPSLKEIWDNNPALKLFAVVGVVVLLFGTYEMFFSTAVEDQKSAVRIGGAASSKQTPGKEELDPAYRTAIEETNKKNAERALRTGDSALPLPIAISKSGELDVAPEAEKPKSNVLAEWKRAADDLKAKTVKEAVEEQQPAPLPESVPMVQPIRPQQGNAIPLAEDPNLTKALAAQMRVIIAAQGPAAAQNLGVTQVESEYRKQQNELAAQKEAQASGGAVAGVPAGSPFANTAGASGTAGGAAPAADAAKIILPAGTIVYGQLINELNSDIPGPVIVQVLSGPFRGGRALGKLQRKDEYVVLSFTQIVKDDVVYSVSATALDEKTTLSAQATDVDHHYFDRIVLPAAAEFIKGYAQSASQVEQQVSATGGVVAAGTQKPDAKQNLFKGVEQAADNIASLLEKDQNKPVTVHVARGTTMGLYFSQSVTSQSVGAR